MADEFLLTETLTIESAEPLKSLGEENGVVRVGAYAVRFADSSEKDLTGDYFTKATDFGPNCGNGAPAMFNHGLPLAKGVKALQEVADLMFGPVKTTRDDVGIFVEHALDTSDQYQKAIAELCAKGKLKWSSGTAAHMMRKNADGEIKRWNIAEVSYTPKPAEFRLPAIAPLKSIDAGLAAEIAAAFGVSVDTTKSTVTSPIISIPLMTDAEKAALKAEQDQAIKSATDRRVTEVNEIVALGNHFKCVEAANEFITTGKSADDFRRHVLENVKQATPVVTDPKIGMNRQEVKSYSILKAIRESHLGKLSGLELEASQATAKAIRKDPHGFFIPHDVASIDLAQSHDLGAEAIKAIIGSIKNLNQTTFASGGALVGTTLMTGSIVELLRNKPLVAQMGAMTLSDIVGNIALPTINGGATAYWLNEQGPATATDQAFGQIGFTPKRLVGRTGYTKELMNQTALSVEALVRNDLTTVLAIAKDLAAINGTGGAQPLGILNTTGIGAVTFGAAATRAKAIEFQKDVAVGNASRGALAYMTSPATAAKWMNIAEAANYPKWLWDGNVDTGVVVGRAAQTTNQMTALGDKVIYANWNDLVLCDFAGIDVVVNPYTNDATGVVTITITLWADSGVRHAVSFAVSSDSGAQ